VDGTCGTHGGGERCLQGFGWRSEGKRPLGRRRRRLEDNIKLDLREIGIDKLNWIRLAQDRVQWGGFCENGNEPSGSIKKAGYFLTG
jgi:hypothetical protein